MSVRKIYQNKLLLTPQRLHKMTLFAAIATPVMTLPQVYQIWIEGIKAGSAITWASYTLIAAIWLLYGLQNRDKPIIIMQSMCVVVYSFVAVGLVV